MGQGVGSWVIRGLSKGEGLKHRVNCDTVAIKREPQSEDYGSRGLM